MFFDKVERRWKPHPLCTCHHDPCYCVNLPPLDAEGKPIGEHGVLGPDYPVKRAEHARKDAA